jgi:hypothetical protein
METAMKQIKKHRPYIERIRRDPRTMALFDSFIYQAMVEVREHHGHAEDPHDAERLAHKTAERAVALAMAFVLDNDGEYEMLRQHNDQLMDTVIETGKLTPRTMILQVEPQELTPEMIEAGLAQYGCCRPPVDEVVAIYKAMVAKRPLPFSAKD